MEHDGTGKYQPLRPFGKKRVQNTDAINPVPHEINADPKIYLYGFDQIMECIHHLHKFTPLVFF